MNNGLALIWRCCARWVTVPVLKTIHDISQACSRGIRPIASCTISRTIFCSLLMNPTLQFRSCGVCIAATVPERRRLSNMGSVCLRHLTTVRSVSMKSKPASIRLFLSRQHRVPMKWKTAHKSLNRLSDQQD